MNITNKTKNVDFSLKYKRDIGGKKTPKDQCPPYQTTYEFLKILSFRAITSE